MNHPKDPDPLSLGDLNPNKIAAEVAEKKIKKKAEPTEI